MVVPRWSVSVDVAAITPNVTGDLDADLRLHPWVVNQEHFAIRPGDWDVAEATIAAEAAAVAAADAASSNNDEFEGHLVAAEANDDGQDWGGLDFGVAGLVMALNAAGFATASSCRKHPGHTWAEYPFVITTGEAIRVDALQPLIQRANAGGCVGPPGEGFGIYADSILPLMRLADLIMHTRSTFQALPTQIDWDQDAYDADADW